ncbi:non-hydrolyzing UDP-N-acetylglucosamine 2-epimerase [Cryobacterium sp. TMT4-10]|uniref:non-hydrolyzing UDP-N-acetylglucosamine 2-epimerase n=1 Tax=Cryobacterium sp. TMT4-10 TaxID=1259256 RepID=UPI001069B795|nr:UDP-N-acetylglucosamine 2-epimerase (non-hydrolyzing) [Cryobacterium sp. TMT4-10]TFD16303.1 UDP-N-acetylglucosamine 2-epimerase (non-hydrolyzing) [Cryobacterium sp. TMT4-10]
MTGGKLLSNSSGATNKLKVVTIVGTRPEIIRLAPTIKLLDAFTEHVLVHTGQNYDYELNEIFFEDLGLRSPDIFLGVDTTSLGTVLGSVLIKTEAVLAEQRPDALVILGDTNSSISALIAKRMKIPVYHMEAGNRSFDENVPEEINRRLVDHISDYNLVYTEHARRNLLAEGIHPSRILLTGSPMHEVLAENAESIARSEVLTRMGLKERGYFLVSMHREENVDAPGRLTSVLEALGQIVDKYELPMLVSTHPRTRKRLEGQSDGLKDKLQFHPPFGFNDYVKLQQSAKLVLSDSGTISEESALLGFPAVTLRDFIERPEALDAGAIISTGISTKSVLQAVTFALSGTWKTTVPDEYLITNTSHRVLAFLLSTAHSHHQRTGIRPTD